MLSDMLNARRVFKEKWMTFSSGHVFESFKLHGGQRACSAQVSSGAIRYEFLLKTINYATVLQKTMVLFMMFKTPEI